MEGLTLETMRAADLDAINALEQRCFSVPWSRHAFEQELENPAACYVVAHLAGRVVGYAGVWIIVDEGHITNVAVHPGFRAQGIGRALVAELIARAQARGAAAMTLEVRPSNTYARRLYEHFGFVGVGVRPGYYEDNHEDALIMWRR
nr:ribosomal protein S18-alanine N-acetyltransferase [Maliibacterium massiliense]